MRSFRKTHSRFPSDMVELLELFGRAEFGHQTSGLDTSEFIQRVLVVYFDESQADPAGFLADLQAVVAGDEGGFATYGAARLVWEYFSERSLLIPAALPLVDAAIDFKLDRHLPPAMFSGYEQRRLADRRDGSV
jgi:hypothetical protein